MNSAEKSVGIPLSIAFMNSIPADVWRGGEKWMVNAATGLAERGHRVLCIGRISAVWLDKAKSRGLEVIALPLHAGFDLLIIARLFCLFKQRRLDLLCCNFEKDVRLGGIAGRLAKVKRIFVRKGLTLLYDKLRYRLAYRYIVDDVISPAAYIKNQFSKFAWLDQGRIHVIPNGVAVPDTAKFNAAKLRALAHAPKTEPVVFGAGRIVAQKGFDYFVEAVALLHGNGIRAHGAIAGGGEEEALASLARERAIAPFIHLLGHRDDIPELMFGADAFVLSSLYEGLPNVVLEAMSVGTPVVAADAGGTSEIINNGENGFVVPVKDARSLAERIAMLLRDDNLRKEFGNAGKDTVKARFSMPAMVNAVEALFVKSMQSSSASAK